MNTTDKIMVLVQTREVRSRLQQPTGEEHKTNIQYLSPEQLRSRLEAAGEERCHYRRAFSANLSPEAAQTAVGRKLERLAARSPYYLLSE